VFKLFKPTLTSQELGEFYANAVFDTLSQVSAELAPKYAIETDVLYEELIYLETFAFERAANKLFHSCDLARPIINAFAAHLILKCLHAAPGEFQANYDERSHSYLSVWCHPPDYQASIFIAGEICRRLGELHYDLLTFLSTHVPRSYSTALEFLSRTNRENTVI
jgi:hypothetical protein